MICVGLTHSCLTTRLFMYSVLQMVCCTLCYFLSSVKMETPSSYGEDMWSKLKESICAIYDERPISHTLNELYQAVENCCSYKMASTLYERLRGVCEEHVVKLLPHFTQYLLKLLLPVCWFIVLCT